MTTVSRHKSSAPEKVACAVITVSDSRTEETDESGRLTRGLLLKAGHAVTYYTVVRDVPGAILDAVDQAVLKADVIVTNGGTGLSPRDVTIETLASHLHKALPGFGELFRMLSHREIGSAAMLSRAIAGVYKDRLLFCLPGSPQAVKLGMEALILPELAHAVGVMRR